MEIEIIGHRGENGIPRYSVRRRSTLWYDQVAAILKNDDTAVVRVDAEGRSHVAIRQAMRVRGLWVHVEAKRVDAPMVTITVAEVDGPVPITPQPALDPRTEILTEDEFIKRYGVHPDTGA